MKALITGASEGIGGAICLRLATQAQQRGEPAQLVMVTSGRTPPSSRLEQELRALGATTTWLEGDLGDVAVPARLVEQAQAAMGGLDLLISNAGMMSPGKLSELSIEAWERTFNVNVRATFLLAQAAIPALRESHGAIVTVSSMSGQHPHAGSGAYSTSKAAVSMLCAQLAQELAADGIRVNCVAPGMIRTPLTEKIYQNEAVAAQRNRMVPIGRVGTPDDIAAVVVFLAGPDAGYINGQTLLADGGYCDSILGLIPGLPNA